MDPDGWLNDTRTSYDSVAAGYAEILRDHLAEKPYLRASLALFAGQVRAGGGGAVADVGCGPGHVTAHLNALGLDAFGVDLSPAMIDIARREHSDLRFEVGSMTELDIADDALAGLLAFWSLIHVPDDVIPLVLGHFHRALRPGGRLLIGFHVGDELRHKVEGYGRHPMNVDVHYRRPDRMTAWLLENGFTVEARMEVDLDQSTPGALLFARRA